MQEIEKGFGVQYHFPVFTMLYKKNYFNEHYINSISAFHNGSIKFNNMEGRIDDKHKKFHHYCIRVTKEYKGNVYSIQ